MIFLEIRAFWKTLKIPLFLTFSTQKVSENYFFDQNLNFPKKYGTSAPDWYFHFGRTPRSSRDLMLQTEMYTFQYSHDHPNFNTFHIVNENMALVFCYRNCM